MNASLPLPLPSSSPPSTPPPPPPSSTPPSTPSFLLPPKNILVAVLRDHRQSYVDGAAAVVLFFGCTLLICGLQQLTASISDFPAPILAMVLVAAVMILAAQFVAGIDTFYAQYLRRPTDLLNRHMSIGFTVPFTMIMKEPMPSSRMVGLIIAGYIITGLLNAILAYVAAFGVQTLLLYLPRLGRSTGASSRRHVTGPAAIERFIPSLRLPGCCFRETEVLPARTRDKGDPRVRSYISDATTLWSHSPAGRGSPTGCNAQEAQTTQPDPPPGEATSTDARAVLVLVLVRVACFVAVNPMLCIGLAAIVLVGVPVAAVTGHETALDVFVLVALWTGTLFVQAAVAGRRDPGRNRWRPVLAALCNAVLWSSLGNMAYLAAKTAARHHASADVLAAFHAGTTLADRIHAPSSATPSSSFGAGDLAVSILDAGIVSWGLKLFECRAQLLSRAGATTLLVGAALALANLVCWPVAVHAMGLTPASRALAFAARGVTLALAGPAMARLGGDVGLNAAMVVFNGIVFQVVMGLVDGVRAAPTGTPRRTDDVEAAVPSENENAALSTAAMPCSTPRRGSATSSGGDTLAESIAAAPGDQPATPPPKPNEVVSIEIGDVDQASASAVDAPATVALGTTVGINAAAMGTAYLYENAGRAAPYAALSMTVFGAMTVVFVSIQPLAGWIVAQTM